jgi:hypothetical protein
VEGNRTKERNNVLVLAAEQLASYYGQLEHVSTEVLLAARACVYRSIVGR